MALGVGADQRHAVVAKMRGRPDRPEHRVDEVGAATGVRRRAAGLDDGGQRALLGVDHHHLVARVGGGQEIALGAVEAAVVQEPLRLDLGDLEVLDVGVVHQLDLAGLLHVDQELRLVVRGDDGGDARLGVVFLRVVDHAARRDDLERLQRVAVHDRVLRRPVAAGDGVFVLIALELGGLDRPRLGADLDLGDRGRLGHPQVDHVHRAVAADHEQIAPGGRNAADVHRIAGVEDLHDLIGRAVDQRDLPRVAQRDREQVVAREVVLRAGRPVLGLDVQLPAGAHLRHAELGRRRRLDQQIARHQIDVLGGERARRAPVGHPGGRAVGDEVAQILIAVRAGDVGGQRLAGRALAQHAVAACAALEIDRGGLVELGLGDHRIARLAAGDLELQFAEAGGAELVLRRWRVAVALGLVLRPRRDPGERDRQGDACAQREQS